EQPEQGLPPACALASLGSRRGGLGLRSPGLVGPGCRRWRLGRWGRAAPRFRFGRDAGATHARRRTDAAPRRRWSRWLPSGREGMLRGILLGDHGSGLGQAGDRALDRELRRLVVVVVDLLVVGGFPVDEDTDAEEEIVALVLRDRALGDAIGD